MADQCCTRYFSQIFPLVLFSLFILTGPAAGAAVAFDHPGSGLIAGEEITVSLILDSAPYGISGFAITITVEDPAVAEITGVTLPAWAELSDIAGVPGPEISILAADIQGSVEKGSNAVVLATLTVKGLSPGTTDIVLSEPIFDDDDGNDIDPDLPALSLVVAGDASTLPSATTSPETTGTTIPVTTTLPTTTTTGSTVLTGGSGGGGSGGGSSSSTGTVSPTSEVPGTDAIGTTVTPAADQPGTPVPESPVQETSQPADAITVPETVMPVSGSQGIPCISVPGIIVLVFAMVLLGKRMK